MQSISVVLPAPLWPMSPRISPSRSCEVDVVDGGDAAEALGELDGTRAAPGVAVRGVDPLAGASRRPWPALTLAGAVAVGGAGAGDEHRAQDVGPVEQLGGRALEAHLALLHEHGPLGQVAGPRSPTARRCTIVVPRRWISRTTSSSWPTIGRRQAERQLVDHQQLGPGHERAAERQHLLLAAGEVAGHLVAALLEDREQLEDLGLRAASTCVRVLADQPRRPAAGSRRPSASGTRPCRRA